MITYVGYFELDNEDKKLLKAAEIAMKTAYNPYSNFFVGAALLSQDGRIITGSNVENAAYGSTICAERAAILKANSEGIRTFYKIALIGKGKDFDAKEPVSPCGSCRQMLYESSQISKHNIELILSNTKKKRIILTTIEDLLPLGFGPKELGINIRRYR